MKSWDIPDHWLAGAGRRRSGKKTNLLGSDGATFFQLFMRFYDRGPTFFSRRGDFEKRRK